MCYYSYQCQRTSNNTKPYYYTQKLFKLARPHACRVLGRAWGGECQLDRKMMAVWLIAPTQLIISANDHSVK